MTLNDYSVISNQYASLDNSGTAHLAFKQVPGLIKKYATGIKTLDYGCGSGCSTSFLLELGLEVQGADISHEMLHEAKHFIKNVPFHLIESGHLPFMENTFDIIFSSFVLFEISSKRELRLVLSEIYRVLKNGGLFIAITGSEELYNHEWLSLSVNFEQNKNLKSGDIAKVLLKDADLVVYDYFWTHDDYQEVIQTSKLEILETLYPLGDQADNYPWKNEKLFPPYVIYVMSR